MRTRPMSTITAPEAGRRWSGSESGSALLIVSMITVILTLLGLSYLAVADQENTIAVNQRNADQLTFVSEAGARMVKAWFDRPVEGDPNTPIFKFMGDYDIRRIIYYDRTQRVFDHDGDPNTADVLADGTSTKPYFRQGLQITTDPNYLSFWDKPYRGSLEAEFLGTEAGPDIVIQSNSLTGAPGLDWLDIINQRVISQNKTVQETVGRIQRIDVYAPPVIDIAGVPTRFGIATVKITATKFRHMGKIGVVPVTLPTSVEVARQVSKMVINEVPYPGPTGPFNTCTAFDINGNVQIHWGDIVAGVNSSVGSGLTQLKLRTKRTVPWASVSRYIGPPDLSNWVTARNGTTDSDFDPWFKFRAGGQINAAPDPNAIQIYPYVPIPPSYDDDFTALFQNSPSPCPDFDYQIWKNVALSGGQNVHYMVYAGTDSYREDGAGTAQDVEAWTDGKDGFWFFDTMDRLPPDPNGSNVAAAVTMSGGWSAGGFIYLNADWDSSGTGGGVNRVVIPPGEPWFDADQDGVADVGEYVNLEYPMALGDEPTVWTDSNAPVQTASVTSTNGITYTYSTDPNARDDQGPPFIDTIAFQGVFYIEGEFQFTGNMNVFGAIVTKGGMTTTSAGTPDVYFDERLIKGDWPPPEIDLPRTMVTFWETDL